MRPGTKPTETKKPPSSPGRFFPIGKSPRLWHVIPALTPQTLDALPDITAFFFGPRAPAKGHYWGIPVKPTRMPTTGPGRGLSHEALRQTELFEIYKRLNMVPGFGDLSHSPKFRGGREIARLRLEFGRAPDIIGMRAGIDNFLYSPGSGKSLILDAAPGNPPTKAAASAMEELALYALLKAGLLQKKLLIQARFGKGNNAAGGSGRKRGGCTRGPGRKDIP